MIERVWNAWVALWDRRESPAALALVRVLVGLALLADFINLARLGVAGPMFTAAPGGYAVDAGGFAKEVLDAGLGPALYVV
ncbi:MAG: hypothetical protein H0T46_26920, partial [Deltaproteobacteria bacterium]|nr:hypothetical protein [Deltaproteobacteria bacterium]